MFWQLYRRRSRWICRRRRTFTAKYCRRRLSGFSGQILQSAAVSRRTTRATTTSTTRRSSRSARLCPPSPGTSMSFCTTWRRRLAMSSRSGLWRERRPARTRIPSPTGLTKQVKHTLILLLFLTIIGSLDLRRYPSVLPLSFISLFPVEQFTWKFKVDSVYHFIQKQPDGMFVNYSMNWCHWFVHICAFCSLHFALNWFVLLFCYNGWPAMMGLVPFWQPFTLCVVAHSFHSCCVVQWRINNQYINKYINLLSLPDIWPARPRTVRSICQRLGHRSNHE